MKPGENLPAFLKPSIDGTGTGFYRVVGERWKKGYKKKSFASGIISGLQRIGVYGDTIYGSSCLAANINGCEYKINSFPPQLRKPAWLVDGIKWMKIKMFRKRDS